MITSHAERTSVSQTPAKRPARHRGYLPLAIALILLCTTGVAYALLSASTATLGNGLTAGTIAVTVVERDASGTIITDPSQVSFGTTAKNVTLKVPDGYSDAIVRARIVPPQMSSSSSGSTVYEAYDMGTQAVAQPNAENLVYAGNFVLHFASDWRDHWLWKDGYFYCRHTVSAGDETETLLTGVTCADGYTPTGDVTVTVLADALQSTPAEAVAQWGLSVSETGVVDSLG